MVGERAASLNFCLKQKKKILGHYIINYHTMVDNRYRFLLFSDKVVIDPHTAVGVACAEKMNLKNFLCLACAHPVKFQETVTKSLGHEIAYDKNFEFKDDEKFEVLNNDYALLRELILSNT